MCIRDRLAREQIPDIGTDSWHKVGQQSRGNFEALQRSDVDDEFGKAVKGRKPVESGQKVNKCEKYPPECSDACRVQGRPPSFSLSPDELPTFIKEALLYLFDNTYAVFFQMPAADDDASDSDDEVHEKKKKEHEDAFATASLRCKMLVFVGKGYIDELVFKVTSLSSENALNITEVYYNHTNETIGGFSDEYQTIHRRKKNKPWIKSVGFSVSTDQTDDFSVVLANNTFYWLTLTPQDNSKMVGVDHPLYLNQKVIEKDDYVFPIANVEFKRIYVESVHNGQIELQRRNDYFHTVNLY